MSKRKDDLIRKFEEKKRVYLMVLGGANEEDALNFDLSKYVAVIRKKHSEFSEEDKKYFNLGYSYMQGDLKVKNLPKNEIPLYFNVLENIRDLSRANLGDISNDPIYNVLKSINLKIAEITQKEFDGFDEETISYYVNQKQEFVRTLVKFMETRYSFNDKEPINSHDFDEEASPHVSVREWDVDARILNQDEYFLLRAFIVDSKNKENNLEKFVSILPSAPWERFDWGKLKEFDFKDK